MSTLFGQKISRREALRLTGMALAGSALAACVTAQPTTAPASEATPTAPAQKVFVFPMADWETQGVFFWQGRQQMLVHNPLVGIDLDGMLQPKLAERWEVSPDSTQFTFFLRQGVKWHDGEEFNAEDVAFTVLRSMEKENLYHGSSEAYGWGLIKGAMAYQAGTADGIEGLEVLDPYTVRMTLERPSVAWLATNVRALIMAPEHVYRDIPIATLQEPAAPIHYLKEMQVGTGPFKWVDGKAAEYVRLERFDDYYEGKPLLDGVLYQVVGDDDKMFLALTKGEIDICGLSGPKYQEAQTLPNVNVVVADRSYVRGCNINKARTYFQDVRVRQALNYAIDRQLLCDTVMVGLATPWYSFIEMNSWVNKDVPTYPYDPEKAKALLAEATAAGTWDPNQEIEISYYQQDTQSQDFVAAIQSYLAAVGVKARTAYYDANVIGELADSANFDLMYEGWSYIDPSQYAYPFRCDDPLGAIFHGALPEVCQEMAVLWEKGSTTSVLEERKAVYDELQRIYAENALYMPLYRLKMAHAINKRVTGFDLNAHTFWEANGNFNIHHGERWDITV